MTDTRYSDWLEAADLNLAAMIKLRMQSIPGSVLQDKDGLLAFSVGCPILDGHLNGILGYKSILGAKQTLEFANQFLRSLGYGFVIWVREHADTDIEKILQNAGLVPRREPGAACMIIEKRLEQPILPESLQFSKVSTKDDGDDFDQVTRVAFDFQEAISQYAVRPVYEFSNPNLSSFLIREGVKPVAAGMVIVEDGIAGLYYIGTVPEARGRGLGEVMTKTLTNAGFSMGARAVVLQASLMGERLYERLGYKTITHYRWYYMLSPLIDMKSGGRSES